jgi:FMN-dependent NADH-azoreductase
MHKNRHRFLAKNQILNQFEYMKKLLHIIATPRDEESRTLRIAEQFLSAFRSSHPDWVVEDLNLSKETLPALTVKRVDGKYLLLENKELYGDMREAWKEIFAHIQRFLSASGYLISTPMWNFTIPYLLKQYIDIIVQPNYLFKYTQEGSEGLVKERKAVVIASYGGQYQTPSTATQNFHEPYLRTILEFIGITDVAFVIAEPTDMGQQREEQTMARAMAKAAELGSIYA